MSSTTHAALTSSKHSQWRTPQWLFDALHAEFRFALDAAADPSNTKCEAFLGPGSPILEDALCGVDWWTAAESYYAERDRPLVRLATSIFLNPPYSREEGMGGIEPWIAAAVQAGEGGVVVGLIPFSPQTQWWRKYIAGHTYRATEVRRFPFRLRFDPPLEGYTGAASGANVNTTVVIWRPTDAYEIAPWAPFERYWVPPGCPYNWRKPKRGTSNGNGDEA